jgi:hypothetical protein
MPASGSTKVLLGRKSSRTRPTLAPSMVSFVPPARTRNSVSSSWLKIPERCVLGLGSHGHCAVQHVPCSGLLLELRTLCRTDASLGGEILNRPRSFRRLSLPGQKANHEIRPSVGMQPPRRFPCSKLGPARIGFLGLAHRVGPSHLDDGRRPRSPRFSDNCRCKAITFWLG